MTAEPPPPEPVDGASSGGPTHPARPGRPTVRDVATRAGVSAKTVSRVLNEEHWVSEATTARVHEAIAELGFRRNDMARLLRVGQSTSTIGMVIEDVGNPFFSGISRAVERSTRERGYLVITGSSDEDPRTERALIRTLLERRVDGLLVVPAGDDHRYLLPEIERGTPVVFMDRPAGAIDVDVVLLDNVMGAHQATTHLAAHGHRRIGILSDDLEVFTMRERLRGYQEALRDADIAEDGGLVEIGAHDTAGAEAATERLLQRHDPATAVFATNNRMAVGALRAIHRLGRPVALVGFDDIELAEVVATPLTVVAHDPQRMGEEACRLLWQRVDGHTGPPERVILPTRLIARGSGELRPPG